MVGHPRHRKEPRPRGQGPKPARTPQASREIAHGADAGEGPPRVGPPREGPPREAGARIAKVLARAGVASRREVERLIAEGRVAVNGRLLSSPALALAADDIVTLDGKVIDAAEPTRLFRYHKPAGLVTSHNDPLGRPTVFGALPPGLPRLISVGRLDLNSEGLLLLTNDGALTHALEAPATGWVRQYRVRAFGRVDQARLDSLKDGITIAGVRYGPIEARLDKAKDKPTGANLWLTVKLAEGKNREVRKVLEALGLTVNRLIRLAYGPFALATLEPGMVEEVGPRAIREQLAGLIDPAAMPRGERALYRARGAAPGRRAARRAPAAPAEAAAAAPKPARVETAAPKKTYKAGWARPKSKGRPAAATGANKAAKAWSTAAAGKGGPAKGASKPARPRRPGRGEGP